MILFSEIEPFAAEWMANQYTEATIDARSIRDLAPADVAGFRRVHFFAGIGGWELALQLAGWPEDEEIWTGSCPCQPFSVAGKRGGTDDERHLWPEFFRLVKACRPKIIFGEQVASSEVVGTSLEAAFVAAVQGGDYAAANKCANRLVKSPGLGSEQRWIDSISADLEGIGYTVWFAVPGAHSVGAPHIRQRLYWVAYAQSKRPAGMVAERSARFIQRPRTGSGSPTLGMADATPSGFQARASDRLRNAEPTVQSFAHGSGPHRLEHAPSDGREQGRAEPNGRSIASGCGIGGLGDTGSEGPQERQDSGRGAVDVQRETAQRNGPWSNAATIHCRDGKSRPISPESGDEPLAYGIPLRAGHIVAALGELGVGPKIAKRIIANARRNRTGRLRGYGNAIVPQCAVEFVKSVMEAVA